MKVNKTQIESLYRFTRKHYVEHFDVQTELVDHLANDIEEIWKANPNLSFYDARQKAFKKFGVFGFMEVVEKKQKQLQKRYWKILWNFAKEWFQLPKIILTIGLIFFFYELLQSPIAIFVIWGVFLSSLFYGLRKFYLIRKRFSKKDKKWMMEDILLIQSNSFVLVFAQYPIHILNFKSEYVADYKTIITSFIIVAIIITMYISLEIIPKKAEELLQEHYPEYKLL